MRERLRIDRSVKASATSLTELFGVGPVIVATPIGHSGDIGRFRNRDHNAYDGTAPVANAAAGRPSLLPA